MKTRSDLRSCRRLLKPPGGQKFCPQTDSDGIFPPAVNGNASYYHGISNDPPVTFTFRNDEYEAVYWMYGGNSIDLCCCVWVDLSYDGAFLLSYCRTQINIRVRRFLDHSCLYDEILETSDPDMFIYIL